MATEVIVAEVVSPPVPAPRQLFSSQGTPHWVFFPFRFFHHIAEQLFGLVCIVVGVGYLATIPIVQFISLGYLLEISGRVAVTGKVTRALVHVQLAARIGGVILGTWLTLLIPNLVSDIRYTAAIIDPAAGTTLGWSVARIIIDGLAAIHILSAWSCGGRLRHFLWPLWILPLGVLAGFRWVCRNTVGRSLRSDVERLWFLAGRYRLPSAEQWFPPLRVYREIVTGQFYQRSRDTVWNLLVVELQPVSYLWVGAQGALGTLIWLAVPVGLMMAGTLVETGAGTLCGWIGGLLLSVVLLYLPFLQVHFVCERRFGAFFEVGRVREQFRRAPIAYLFAIICTLAFAIPLYLLKIELTPKEMTWLPSLPFVAFILPAKIITGWAVSRAFRHPTNRFILFRMLARVIAWPVCVVYVFIVFISQYVTWNGVWQLLEQHAFLVPAPF